MRSSHDASALIDAFAAIAEPVRFRFLWRPQLKDPADEMVLETAVNGGANRLVTFDLPSFGIADRRLFSRAGGAGGRGRGEENT